MSVSEVNIALFRIIYQLGIDYPFLNPVIIFIAEYLLYILMISLVVFWFTGKNRNRMMVICALVTVLLAEILGKLAGRVHSNLQPFVELTGVQPLIEKQVGNSFPSDHTIIFFSICVTILLFKKGWNVLWLLLAISVGVSRIWVGVHYPGDVLTAVFISILSAFFVFKMVPRNSFINRVLKVNETTVTPAKSKNLHS